MTILLRLAFTGDVCLGSGAFEHATDRSLDSLFLPFADLFAGHDLVIGNLECALVAAGAPRDVISRKMAVPVERATGLRGSGFSVLTLANNHVLDCGSLGLAWTIEELSRQGIASCGAGSNLSDAIAPLRMTVHGRNITIITACDYSAHFATATRTGIAPLTAARLREQVERARSGSDLVVVILHADLEFSDYPAPWRVTLARQLVDTGAHIVVQHHPHVFQGYERHGAGVIAYSLGNFVFKVHGNEYQQGHPDTAQGLVLSVQVDFKGDAPQVGARFIPIRIGIDHFPELASGAEEAAILARLDTLSNGLGHPNVVRSAWRWRCEREARRFAYSVYYAARRGRAAEAVGDIWSALRVPEERRWLTGWLTRGAR